MTRPAATVVVPTRNHDDLITGTLQALLASDHPDFTLLVIDQSTDDRTRRSVAATARGDSWVLVASTATMGLSAARNLGVELAATEVVAYTDDDCIVDRGWLAAILEEFENPVIAAVYGRQLPWEAGPRTGTETGVKADMKRKKYTSRIPPWYVGHGGNMAFRRADLLAVGGFDPLLGAGGFFGSNEDGDIAYRLLASGRRVVYTPKALDFHKHWKTWPARQQMERAYGVGTGAQCAKYIRCGDLYAIRLFAAWTWWLGVRRMGAGLLKFRSPRPMYLAYCQLVYPWLGVWRSLRCQVDRRTMLYVER